jgi:hypothetical protein
MKRFLIFTILFPPLALVVFTKCSRNFTEAGNGMNLPELRVLLDRSLD